MGTQYDVARDGWFLIDTVLEDIATSPITLIQDWHAMVDALYYGRSIEPAGHAFYLLGKQKGHWLIRCFQRRMQL